MQKTQTDEYSTKCAMHLKHGDIIERNGWDMTPERLQVDSVISFGGFTDITYKAHSGNGTMTVACYTSFVLRDTMTEVDS